MSNERGKRRQPRQARSRALVDAVLQAATEQLEAEDGKISMKAIARRAGVSIGSVYEYFSSKEAIVDGIVDRLAENNFQRLKKTLDDAAHLPLTDAVVPLIDDVFAVYLESPRLTRFALKTVMAFGRMDFVIKERDRFRTVIGARIQTDLPRITTAEAELSAMAMTEMLSGIVMGELYRPQDNERRQALRAAVIRAARAELNASERLNAERTECVAQ